MRFRDTLKEIMGMTYVKTIVKNPQNPSKKFEGDFLVDSGATYSVVPGKNLKVLGIKPHREVTFVLADGRKRERAEIKTNEDVYGVS